MRRVCAGVVPWWSQASLGEMSEEWGCPGSGIGPRLDRTAVLRFHRTKGGSVKNAAPFQRRIPAKPDLRRSSCPRICRPGKRGCLRANDNCASYGFLRTNDKESCRHPPLQLHPPHNYRLIYVQTAIVYKNVCYGHACGGA